MSALHALIHEGQQQAQAPFKGRLGDQAVEDGVFAFGAPRGLQVALHHGLREPANIPAVAGEVDVVDEPSGIRELIVGLQSLRQREDDANVHHDALDRLMPTLTSRCRKLPLSAPSHAASLAWLESKGVDDAASWLSASGGAPVLAFERSQQESDPCPVWLQTFVQMLSGERACETGALVDVLVKSTPSNWLDALQRLSVDLSLLAHGMPVRYYPGLHAALRAVADRTQPAHLSDLGNWVNAQRRIAQHPLNPKLFAQAVLDRFTVYCAPVHHPVD